MRVWLVNLAALVCLGLVVWAATVAGGYSPYNCSPHSETSYQACNYLETFFFPLRLIARYIGHHEPFFVAFGTLVIAGFTATLRGSTYLLWTQNERNFAKLERAYLFLGNSGGNVSGGTATLTTVATNWGRSFGVVKRACAYFVLECPTKTTPVYDQEKISLYDLVIGVGGKEVPLDLNTVSAGPQYPQYLIGFIDYEDIVGSTHTSRACMCLTSDGKITPAGPPAWNDWD